MTKKVLLRSALVLSLVPLLSGCVTDQKFRNLQFNVRNIDNRLVDLENQTEEISSGGTNATQTLQKRQAEQASELERLATEMLQLQGQLDETRHHSRQLQEENHRLQQELDNRLLNLEATSQDNAAKLTELVDNIAAIKAKIAEEADKRAKEALRAAEEARRRAAAAAAAQAAAEAAASQNSQTKELTPRIHKKKKDEVPAQVAAEPATVAKTVTQTGSEPSAERSPSEKLYDTGLGQYRSNDYKGAITSFTRFLDQYKEDKLVPSARFWLGSSLLNSGDYSGAVLEFQNIVADYPGHPKAPEALLKQAKAFEHFGDKMVQKKLYQDILTYYPDSEQATKAKQMLKKLQ